MKNITGTFVGIYRSLLSRLAVKWARQSFVAFCVSGILGTEVITPKNISVNENRSFQDRKMYEVLH